jgi:tRNA modification GTPase
VSLNQAIVLTPLGVGAIAVIRITGPRMRTFLENHFSKRATESRCVYGELREGDRVLDDAVVVLLPDDKGADLNVHGGVWVVESMLELLKRDGFEIHRAGELPPPDASLDGESVIEREMLAYLPLARSREAIGILLAQPGAWQRWREDPSRGPEVVAILEDRSLWWLLNPPRVAIAGIANVGKSTLANQLFAQARSITADLPGTTRDWVGESANLDGLVVTLVDTPGLRATEDPIERAAIMHSAEQMTKADFVLLVLDASIEFSDQAHLVDRFPMALPVINKSDRALVWTNSMPRALRTVATTGEGVDALRAGVRARFGCETFDPHRPRWWTLRQREILQQMKQSAGAASAAVERVIGG